MAIEIPINVEDSSVRSSKALLEEFNRVINSLLKEQADLNREVSASLEENARAQDRVSNAVGEQAQNMGKLASNTEKVADAEKKADKSSSAKKAKDKAKSQKDYNEQLEKTFRMLSDGTLKKLKDVDFGDMLGAVTDNSAFTKQIKQLLDATEQVVNYNKELHQLTGVLRQNMEAQQGITRLVNEQVMGLEKLKNKTKAYGDKAFADGQKLLEQEKLKSKLLEENIALQAKRESIKTPAAKDNDLLKQEVALQERLNKLRNEIKVVKSPDYVSSIKKELELDTAKNRAQSKAFSERAYGENLGSARNLDGLKLELDLEDKLLRSKTELAAKTKLLDDARSVALRTDKAAYDVKERLLTQEAQLAAKLDANNLATAKSVAISEQKYRTEIALATASEKLLSEQAMLGKQREESITLLRQGNAAEKLALDTADKLVLATKKRESALELLNEELGATGRQQIEALAIAKQEKRNLEDLAVASKQRAGAAALAAEAATDAAMAQKASIAADQLKLKTYVDIKNAELQRAATLEKLAEAESNKATAQRKAIVVAQEGQRIEEALWKEEVQRTAQIQRLIREIQTKSFVEEANLQNLQKVKQTEIALAAAEKDRAQNVRLLEQELTSLQSGEARREEQIKQQISLERALIKAQNERANELKVLEARLAGADEATEKRIAQLQEEERWLRKIARAQAEASPEVAALRKQHEQLEAAMDRSGRSSARFSAGLWAQNQAMAALRATMSSLGANIGIYTTATLATATSVYAFTAAVRAAMETAVEFEDQLAHLGAISIGDVLAEDFSAALSELEQKAIDVSSSTRFLATEVVDAMKELGMAGLDSNQILATVDDTLKLAAIGAIDFGEAADIATNVLMGFRLSIGELGHGVNVLAKAVTDSNQTISQLGNALSYAAPVAESFGISLETATAATEVLANAGIKASRAGTGLRRIMLSLYEPTTKGAKAMAAYGIALDETVEPQDQMLDLLDQFYFATAGASKNIGLLSDVVGVRAAPAFIQLVKSVGDGTKSISQLRKELEAINSDGAADEMFARISDTLKTDWLEFQGSLEALSITAFNQIKGDIREIITEITAFVRVLSYNSTAVRELWNEVKNLSESLGALLKLLMSVAVVVAFYKAMQALILATGLLNAGIAAAHRGFTTLAAGGAAASASMAATTASIAGATAATAGWTRALALLRVALVGTGVLGFVVLIGSAIAALWQMSSAVEEVADSASSLEALGKLKFEADERVRDLRVESSKLRKELDENIASQEIFNRQLENLDEGSDAYKALSMNVDELARSQEGLEDSIKQTNANIEEQLLILARYEVSAENLKLNSLRDQLERSKKELEEAKLTNPDVTYGSGNLGFGVEYDYAPRERAIAQAQQQIDAVEARIAQSTITLQRLQEQYVETAAGSNNFLDTLETLEARLKAVDKEGLKVKARFAEISSAMDELYSRPSDNPIEDIFASLVSLNATQNVLAPLVTEVDTLRVRFETLAAVYKQVRTATGDASNSTQAMGEIVKAAGEAFVEASANAGMLANSMTEIQEEFRKAYLAMGKAGDATIFDFQVEALEKQKDLLQQKLALLETVGAEETRQIMDRNAIEQEYIKNVSNAQEAAQKLRDANSKQLEDQVQEQIRLNTLKEIEIALEKQLNNLAQGRDTNLEILALEEKIKEMENRGKEASKGQRENARIAREAAKSQVDAYIEVVGALKDIYNAAKDNSALFTDFHQQVNQELGGLSLKYTVGYDVTSPVEVDKVTESVRRVSAATNEGVTAWGSYSEAQRMAIAGISVAVSSADESVGVMDSLFEAMNRFDELQAMKAQNEANPQEGITEYIQEYDKLTDSLIENGQARTRLSEIQALQAGTAEQQVTSSRKYVKAQTVEAEAVKKTIDYKYKALDLEQQYADSQLRVTNAYQEMRTAYAELEGWRQLQAAGMVTSIEMQDAMNEALEVGKEKYKAYTAEMEIARAKEDQLLLSGQEDKRNPLYFTETMAKEVASSYGSARVAQEKYILSMADLNATVQKGYLSQQEYARAVREIGLEYMKAQGPVKAYAASLIEEMGTAEDQIVSMFDNLKDVLADFFETGKIDAKSFVDTIKRQFAENLAANVVLGFTGGMNFGAAPAAPPSIAQEKGAATMKDAAAEMGKAAGLATAEEVGKAMAVSTDKTVQATEAAAKGTQVAIAQTPVNMYSMFSGLLTSLFGSLIGALGGLVGLGTASAGLGGLVDGAKQGAFSFGGLSNLSKMFTSNSIGSTLGSMSIFGGPGMGAAGPLTQMGAGMAAIPNYAFGAGGLLGSLAGNLIFNGKGYSGIGSSLGSMAGSVAGGASAVAMGAAAGSVVPVIGTIIGGVIGGIAGGGLGSMFGGSKKKPQYQGSVYGGEFAAYDKSGQLGRIAEQYNQSLDELEQLLGGTAASAVRDSFSKAGTVYKGNAEAAAYDMGHQYNVLMSEMMYAAKDELIDSASGAYKEILTEEFNFSGYMNIEKFQQAVADAKASMEVLTTAVTDNFGSGVGEIVGLTGNADADVDILFEFAKGLGIAVQNMAADLGEAMNNLTVAASAFEAVQSAYSNFENMDPSKLVEIGKAITGFAGGLEKFTTGYEVYWNNFLSDNERAAITAKNAANAISRAIGEDWLKALPDREAFVSYIEGIDLTTEQGQSDFGNLIELAPYFDALYSTMENLGSTLEDLIETMLRYTQGVEISSVESMRGSDNMKPTMDYLQGMWTKGGDLYNEVTRTVNDVPIWQDVLVSPETTTTVRKYQFEDDYQSWNPSSSIYERANADLGGSTMNQLGSWMHAFAKEVYELTSMGTYRYVGREGQFSVDPNKQYYTASSRLNSYEETVVTPARYESRIVGYSSREVTENVLDRGVGDAVWSLYTQLLGRTPEEGKGPNGTWEHQPWIDRMVELGGDWDRLITEFMSTNDYLNEVSAAMERGAESLEKLDEGWSAYQQYFMTEAERNAMTDDVDMREVTERLGKWIGKDLGQNTVLGGIENFQIPTTMEEFKYLIENAVTGTVPGSELYGALMSLADEFARLWDLDTADEAGYGSKLGDYEILYTYWDKFTLIFSTSAEDAAKALVDLKDSIDEVTDAGFQSFFNMQSQGQQSKIKYLSSVASLKDDFGFDATNYTRREFELDQLNGKISAVDAMNMAPYLEAIFAWQENQSMVGGIDALAKVADKFGMKAAEDYDGYQGIIDAIYATSKEEQKLWKEAGVRMYAEAGGLEGFEEGINTLFDTIYTDDEKAIKSKIYARDSIDNRMKEAGLDLSVVPDSRQELKDLIEGLDMTKEEDRILLGILADLAPEFATLFNETEALAEATKQASDALQTWIDGLVGGDKYMMGSDEQLAYNLNRYNQLYKSVSEGNFDDMGELTSVADTLMQLFLNNSSSLGDYGANIGSILGAIAELQRLIDAGKITEKEDDEGFASGGIATGPLSGYTATLHGTEAIIPLDRGNVPVMVTGDGEDSDNGQLLSEVRALRMEVARLLDEQKKSNKRTNDVLGNFQTNGVPLDSTSRAIEVKVVETV